MICSLDLWQTYFAHGKKKKNDEGNFTYNFPKPLKRHSQT